MLANDQLTALDATFLELEQASDSALMQIRAAFVFSQLPGGGTPAIGELRAHLRQRLELLPRYRQKLDAPRTGGLTWPSWERDERFEIEAHVRHATLPSPGGERELLSWISDFHAHRLDRNRPLWEMVLFRWIGGGGWTVVIKTHHCLVDGIGTVGVEYQRPDRIHAKDHDGQYPTRGSRQRRHPGLAPRAGGARARQRRAPATLTAPRSWKSERI